VASLHEQISQLESAIAAQERLRPTLGDAGVDATIAAIQAQLVALRGQTQAASLISQVETLETSDLVRIHALEPELEYIFKHALIQDTAYQSLLMADRKALHRKVGEAIETLFGDRLGDFAGILGEHFRGAEAWDKAAGYLVKAGDAAARVFAHIEARHYYAGALDALERLPETDDVLRRWIDAILGMVNVSLRSEGPQRSLERLAQAEAMAGRLDSSADDDRLRMARIHYWMGHAYTHHGQREQAMDYLGRVLPVALELGDQELIAIPSAVMGRVLAFQGDFAKAEPVLDQALAPLAQVGNWHEWILTTSVRGWVRAVRGSYAAGLADIERALDRAQELATLTGIGQCHGALAISYMFGREHESMLEEGLATVEAGQQNADQLIQYLGYGLCGWAESRLGRHAQAREAMQRAQAIARSIGGHPVMSDMLAAGQAEISLNAGLPEEACSLAEQASSFAGSIGGVLAQGMAHRVWGQAVAGLTPPRWDEVAAHFDEAMRLFELADARLELVHTWVAQGQLLHDQARLSEAQDVWAKAAAQFESFDLPGQAAQVKKLLQA
jgi:tetratricopeptide (TPR) repeat protein